MSDSNELSEAEKRKPLREPGEAHRFWRFRILDLSLGLVVGFGLGYLLQEELAQLQPPPSANSAVRKLGTGTNVLGAESMGSGSNPMAAIEELRAALERNPNDTVALLALANLNFDIQRWPRAEELYRRYLALQPEDADARTDLGVVLRAQGRIAEALREFQAVREKDPHHWQARFNEVLILAFDQGQYEAAEARLKELRALAPAEPAVERLAAELRTRRAASR